MRTFLRARFAAVALPALLAGTMLFAVPGAHAAAYHSGPGNSGRNGYGPGYSMMDDRGPGYTPGYPAGGYCGPWGSSGVMGYYPGYGWSMGYGR